MKDIEIKPINDPYLEKLAEQASECSEGSGGCGDCPVKDACVGFWDRTVCNSAVTGWRYSGLVSVLVRLRALKGGS